MAKGCTSKCVGPYSAEAKTKPVNTPNIQQTNLLRNLEKKRKKKGKGKEILSVLWVWKGVGRGPGALPR